MEILLAALVGGFLLFNANATPQKAEKIIEASLRKTYPRATIDAQVEGKRGRAVLKGNFRRVRLEMAHLGNVSDLPFGAAGSGAGTTVAASGNAPGVAPVEGKAGHLGRLELALRDFHYNDLPVESAEFAFDDVTYDMDALKRTSKLMLWRSGPASGRLILDAPALERLFARSLKGVRDVKISLRDGRVIMNAKKVLPLFDLGVPFILTARPEPRGNEIWLTDGRVAMENTTGFSLSVKNLLNDLNPIYAFDPERKGPFRVRIISVDAQNDKMDIGAELTFARGAAE